MRGGFSARTWLDIGQWKGIVKIMIDIPHATYCNVYALKPESHCKYTYISLSPQFPLILNRKTVTRVAYHWHPERKCSSFFFPSKSLGATLQKNCCCCQLAETGCRFANGHCVSTCVHSVCSDTEMLGHLFLQSACHLLRDLHTSVTPIISRHSPSVGWTPEECEIV